MAPITVMTINLWNYNRFPERKQKIIDYIRALDPDVVALQEVRDDGQYNAEGHHQAKQLNDSLGYPHIVYAQTMDLNVVDKTDLLVARTEGLAFLSKYPVLSHRKIMLKKQPEDKFTRGILWIRVQADLPVDIINVHFTPHTLFSELHLLETLAIAKKLKIHPIILGDFNMYNQELLFRHTEEDYLSSARLHPYTSYPSREWTLDYILIPRAASFLAFSCGGDGLSDHRVLTATVALSESASSLNKQIESYSAVSEHRSDVHKV
jgi:endonuclease/exonuclease/phosphatase family metal-dependent hydrolase